MGVGVGIKVTNGVATGTEALQVFVKNKVSTQSLELKDVIPPTVSLFEILPDGVRSYNSFETDVVEIGDVIKFLQGGDSVGHYKITAGTAGCSVIDRATQKRLLLSNNHVLANENNCFIGDAILSPGPFDGGIQSRDVIGFLARFERIYFYGEYPEVQEPEPEPEMEKFCNVAKAAEYVANLAASAVKSRYRLMAYRPNISHQNTEPYGNLIDAAVCSLNVDNNFPSISHIGKPTGVYDDPSLNLVVHKKGRTTGYTSGQIMSKYVTIDVSYSVGHTARFKNQIIVGPGGFSAPGDSGSLVLSKSDNRAVGLLFAGSDSITVISPMQTVLDSMKVDLEI